eukprot:10934289-Lingulodinium_polyedra.AAC.1
MPNIVATRRFASVPGAREVRARELPRNVRAKSQTRARATAQLSMANALCHLWRAQSTFGCRTGSRTARLRVPCADRQLVCAWSAR